MNMLTEPLRWFLVTHGRCLRATPALLIVVVTAVLATGAAQAQTYAESVLYSFAGAPDGAYPYAALTLDSQGNLYGTTWLGGVSNGGIVFKVDTSGNETVLYRFCSEGSCTDGAEPLAGLAMDMHGNFYGTTYAGGAYGGGTVFKLDTAGNESVLHSFTGTDGDGAQPETGLVRDAQGNFYGTTRAGGAANAGTVFKLSASGKETVLYTFCAEGNPCTDGAVPYSTPTRDTQGNLYGTTSEGGASGGYGTVFKLDTTGKETVLYTFTGTGGDGATPVAGLVRDAQANLYGTTLGGGDSGCAIELMAGCGTVFKLDATGKETVLYAFTGTDGAYPSAGVVRDSQGNLYGTASIGGTGNGGGCTDNCGTVFKLSAAGKGSVLYDLTGTGGDGGNPYAAVVEDAQGNLYGTTGAGGAYGYGTVFKLTLLTATTTTLTSLPNPSTHGQAVIFTATVGSSKGAPPDGEFVSFMQGTTVLGTGTLSGGSADFATSTLTVGTHSVTAVYTGDSTFGASTSKPVKQVVNKAAD